jgi:prepilin-type N-terminal cleavage/methylation domain-containing protein
MLRHSRGFSLIEVLVATGILVTVAAGTAQLFAVALRQDVASRQQLAMAAIARTKIDELAAVVARATVPAASAGAIDRTISGYSDVVTADGAAFERRWLVAPVAVYSATAVVIVVRVSARAGLAGGSIELATIADAGMP